MGDTCSAHRTSLRPYSDECPYCQLAAEVAKRKDADVRRMKAETELAAVMESYTPAKRNHIIWLRKQRDMAKREAASEEKWANKYKAERDAIKAVLDDVQGGQE